THRSARVCVRRVSPRRDIFVFSPGLSRAAMSQRAPWCRSLPSLLASTFCADAFSSRMSFFFFQAEDGIRDFHVTGVQTCALPISPWVVDQRVIGTVRALPVFPEDAGVEPLAYTPRIDACLSGDFTYLAAEDPNGIILVREIHTETGQIVRDYEIGKIDNYPLYKPRVAPHGPGVRVYFLNQGNLWFADISGGSVSSNTLVDELSPGAEYDVLPGGVCAYATGNEGSVVVVYDNGVVHQSDTLSLVVHGVALPVGWTSSTSWLVVVYGRIFGGRKQSVGTLQLGASDRAYAEFDDLPDLDSMLDIRGFRLDSVGACLGPDDTVFVTVHHPNVSSTGDAGGQFTEPAPWT